jgi:hypothetical protein
LSIVRDCLALGGFSFLAISHFRTIVGWLLSKIWVGIAALCDSSRFWINLIGQ